VIYDVLGQYAPIWPTEDVTVDDKKVKIGELRLETNLLTSDWADSELFFQHRQITIDYKFWPKSWRRFHLDKFFDKTDPENVFGFETPAWPEDPAEAQNLYE